MTHLLPLFPVYALAIVLVLWSSGRFFKKRSASDSYAESQSGERLPKGAFVYSCDSPQSYENIKSFIGWVAKSPGREAKAIILILNNHLNPVSKEWDALSAAMEKAKALQLIFVVVPVEDATSELISRSFPPRTEGGVAFFETVEEARDYLEIELSIQRSN
ncbi:hypothetical protein WDW37_18420 [Bdellovibrionota bacterium FG-1]